MRNSLLFAACAAVLAGVSGCAMPGATQCCSSTGWHFSIGKPSTLSVNSPVVMAQGAGPVAVQPLGAMTGAADGVLHAPAPLAHGPRVIAPPVEGPEIIRRPLGNRPQVRPEDDCTLQKVCDKLDKLIDHLLPRKEE